MNNLKRFGLSMLCLQGFTLPWIIRGIGFVIKEHVYMGILSVVFFLLTT